MCNSDIHFAFFSIFRLNVGTFLTMWYFFVFQLIIYYIFLFKRYDLKETSKLTLQDVQLICAMGPPGGGRNDVTLRFMRHFNIIGMNSFSEETMIKIFSILISTYLRVSRECFFHFCYQFYYLINTDFF